MKANKNNSKKTTVIAPAIVPEIHRPIPAILAELVYDNDGNASVKAGNHLTWQELSQAAASWENGANSARLRAVNTLRLSRMLPAVKEKNDKGEEIETTAFDKACDGLRALLPTESTFSNVLGMVAVMDVKEKYKLTANPYAVKEAMGTLRRLGVLPKEGKALPDRLITSEGDKKKAAPVVKALKEGMGANKLREVLDKVKDKPAKKAPAVPAASDKEINNPAALGRAIVSVRGLWEKAVGFHGIPAVRNAVNVWEVYLLAKLAGLDVKNIPTEPKQQPVADTLAGK